MRSASNATFAWLLVCLLSISTVTNVEAAEIQKPGLSQSAEAKQRADAIREAYRGSYNDYKKYAFGQDELKPLSKTGETAFGGWGATIVDSLSTSYIMGLEDLYDEGVKFVKTVDFSKTESSTISLFETNIRYLGGILSAYELGGKKESKLLDQAKVIGDHLLTGWVGQNDLPYNSLSWNGFGKPDTSKSAGIAEAGTLILEFDRLTRYTGDKKYLDYAERAMRAIINSQPVFPGLYPQNYDPKTNKNTSDYVTWGGGSDSFFEYLIKYAYLIGSDQGPWIPTWISSVKSSIKYLITKPEGTKKKQLTYLTDYSESSGGNLPRFSHLGCFVGGNWILGAKMLGIKEFNDYGLELTESCINTYTSSPTGIGPESFVYIGAGNNTNGVEIKDQDFYRKNGFDFEVAQYILRPEVIESVFYAWRTTGDSRWQDLAWQAWKSIEKYCKAPAAFAAIENVASTRTKQYDDSESFFYAETFKYLYLTFADPSVVNLDEYVFTTEAHLFKVDNPSKSYHSEFGRIEKPKTKHRQATGTKTSPPVPKFSSHPGLKSIGDFEGEWSLDSVLEALGLQQEDLLPREALEAHHRMQRRMRVQPL